MLLRVFSILILPLLLLAQVYYFHFQRYSVLYDTDLKIPIEGSATIYGEEVKVSNKKRLSFRPYPGLDKRLQASNKDFYKLGYDKGHTIISDDSSDFNIDVLKESYYFVNITPQTSHTNRSLFRKLEIYFRKLALKYGKIQVITIVLPSDKFIGNGVNVPRGFIKMIVLPNNTLFRCFYIPNNKTGRIKPFECQ